MKLWAVVPVKAFSSAKSRLEPSLEGAQRQAFAQGLFEHVSGELLRHAAIERLLVVTNSEQVQAHATALGATAIKDPADSKVLGQIVDAALRHAEQQGATHGLVLMGDLPRLSQVSLSRLIAALALHPQVIVSDRHQVATNALGLKLPCPAPTAFGSGDSLRLHLARFPAARWLRDPELELDVDEPNDLDALSAHAAAEHRR